MSVLLLCLLTADANAWTGFLGPPNAELSLGDLPVEWSPESVAYTIAIEGYGQSSPVVYDGVIYVTSVEGDNKETNRVSAFALDDGAALWTKTESNPTPEANNVYVSRGAPTPVVDAAGVIAFFEGGRLVAYAPDGEVRWNRDLTADYGPIKAAFGLSASLVQNDDHVFVHVERQQPEEADAAGDDAAAGDDGGDEAEPYILALNKSDGQTVWKVPGFGSSTWASPMLMDGPDGDTQLVVTAKGFAGGFDPATGERLWTLDGLNGNSSDTPYPAGAGRFLIGGSGGRENPDGPASNGLIAITKSDDGRYAASMVWEAEKARSSFGSPVAADGMAYFVNRSGALFSYDLDTGEPVFTKRIGDSGWATPLVAGDRIYFVGKDGLTTVIKTGREYEELARNRTWPESSAPAKFGAGPIQYAVVGVDGTLLLRAGDTIYAVRK